MILIDGAGLGDDLLHERYMEIVGQSQAAGAGNGQSDRFVAAISSHEFLVNVFKQSRHCGAYVGVMATIVGEEHAIERVGLVEHHGLHRGRTDVKTYTRDSTAVSAASTMYTSIPIRSAGRPPPCPHR